MKKNRRRSLRAAEPVSTTPAEAHLPPVTPGKSRRRSHRPAEMSEANRADAAPENPQMPAEPPAAQAGRSRRRSHRLGEPDPRRESAARSGEPPAVGALSGQLPPGAVRESGVIATEAGRYLRQAARDEAPSRFGSPAGEVDDSARRVWEIAFGLVVRRRFEPGAALAEISRTVATAVHDHAAAAMPMLDAEMLVRAALGEAVPVGDLDGGVLIAVHLLLFASLADELALGEAELDQLIAEAEEKAAALVGV
ncbi:hypothetical protein ACIA5D_03835 [Actinoplanes sp. NPDC051513]|uniref:hypothetical protein n=1 Tax=Actinoplanes sp. NPDC051513 TaxID=3363908 RepID=UPI0037A74960